jgi:methylation protein EvaC
MLQPPFSENGKGGCSFCGCALIEIMDFGNVALAGAFLKPKDFENEKFYPLRLGFCQSCLALQVMDKVEPEILFKNYFYCSSSINTLKKHFTEYAEKIAALKPSFVVEIGCNDGVMLRPLKEKIPKVIGVDPANIAAEGVINDFFSEALAKEIAAEHGKADVIIANNVFAHIPDINGVTRGIAHLLGDNGVFVFEVHSLDKMIEGGQYDWVYHEHLYYYSLLALEKHFSRHGMMIYDIEPTGLHAGSRRYYACKDDRTASERVAQIRQAEIDQGLHLAETFYEFAERAKLHKLALLNVLGALRGKKIVGYGACGRANTMIQYCGIDHSHMAYIIDDAPTKHGYFTPGSHFEIRPRDELDADYLLVFAWSFLSDITKKCSGYPMIIPLPYVQIKDFA